MEYFAFKMRVSKINCSELILAQISEDISTSIISSWLVGIVYGNLVAILRIDTCSVCLFLCTCICFLISYHPTVEIRTIRVSRILTRNINEDGTYQQQNSNMLCRYHKLYYLIWIIRLSINSVNLLKRIVLRFII